MTPAELYQAKIDHLNDSLYICRTSGCEFYEAGDRCNASGKACRHYGEIKRGGGCKHPTHPKFLPLLISADTPRPD
ncbi:MAG: hypothetical protein Rhob2KO_12480 [Rhodopirellula baltica]